MLRWALPALLFSLPAHAVYPLVVLDPGHEPSKPGARGVCGQWENVYNDKMAASVKNALDKSGVFRTVLTHEAGKETNFPPELQKYIDGFDATKWDQFKVLWGRPALANSLQADAYVSIHHDSTVDAWQEPNPKACPNGDPKPTRLKGTFFSGGYKVGYTVWVYRPADVTDVRYLDSLELAKAIARRLKNNLHRPSSNYHSDRGDCQSCAVIDADLGVWHQNLAVLRMTKIPAVLIEVGVIADVGDEAKVNTDSFRAGFSREVMAGIAEYFIKSKQNRYRAQDAIDLQKKQQR